MAKCPNLKQEGPGRKAMSPQGPRIREERFPQSAILTPHWSEVGQSPPTTGKGVGSCHWLTSPFIIMGPGAK